MRFELLAAILSVTACARPEPLVICHNANCVGPTDPSRDDTLEALTASLALVYEGRPLLDGVEIDTVWDRIGDRCVFAHDLRGTAAVSPDAAAEIVAAYVSRPDRVAWNGERFHVFIELKRYVTRSRAPHTSAERDLHADCALELLGPLRRAAASGRHPLTVTFESSSPELLRALEARPAWPGRVLDGMVELRLGIDLGAPFNLENPSWAEITAGPTVDVVEVHASWLTEGARETLRSLGVDVGLWMDSATSETFQVIERIEPRYVVTSEAPLMRRWIDW